MFSDIQKNPTRFNSQPYYSIYICNFPNLTAGLIVAKYRPKLRTNPKCSHVEISDEGNKVILSITDVSLMTELQNAIEYMNNELASLFS